MEQLTPEHPPFKPILHKKAILYSLGVDFYEVGIFPFWRSSLGKSIIPEIGISIDPIIEM